MKTTMDIAMICSIISGLLAFSCKTSNQSTIKSIYEPSPNDCIAGKLRDGPNGSKFAQICPGVFMMGSPESETNAVNQGSYDEPGSYYATYRNDGRITPQQQRRVTISRGFEIQTTELTQEQWFLVTGGNPSKYNSSNYCENEYRRVGDVSLCPNLPVTGFSNAYFWLDKKDPVSDFIKKLNEKKDGYQYRLPTEAEWEYAARAGSQRPYGVEGKLEEFAWYADAPRLGASRLWGVAKKKPNAWGLYDMHGNAAEITSDLYRESFSPSAVRDPQSVARSECDGKINPSGTIGCHLAIRGGSFVSRAGYCRSASRSDLARFGIDYLNQYIRHLDWELIGLRLVRTKTKL